MIVSGIYKISSKIKPDRIYVGSSFNVYYRWKKHLNYLRKNKHDNIKIQNHFNKYGELDLDFEILLLCDKDKLFENEQFYIDKLKPWFNICPIAGNCKGVKQSQETIQKRISKIKGRPSKNKGKKLGKRSLETRKRLSDSKMGSKNPNFGKPPVNKGIPRSEETRKKISEALIGNIPWNKGTAKPKEKKPKRLASTAFKKGHLPWCTGKSLPKKMIDRLIELGEQRSVPVLQYDKDGNFIKEWKSFASVRRELNISSSNVVQCAKGKTKSAGGFVWKYKNVA